MSELKPCQCPLCGGELKISGPEDWTPTFYDPDSGGDPYEANCDCGFSFSTGTYDYAEFVAALNRRAQPANEPLTLEELRGMDGEPVYLKIADGVWGLVDTDDREIALSRGGIIDLDRVIGLAYRRKPEGSENDA